MAELHTNVVIGNPTPDDITWRVTESGAVHLTVATTGFDRIGFVFAHVDDWATGAEAMARLSAVAGQVATVLTAGPPPARGGAASSGEAR